MLSYSEFCRALTSDQHPDNAKIREIFGDFSPEDFAAIRRTAGMTQRAFSSRYGIPFCSWGHWERCERLPPPYIGALLAYAVYSDIVAEGQK